MTENEIIDFLEDEINGLEEQKYGELGEIAAKVFKEINGDERIKVFKAAISALKKIQQYREIGTVEECREAVDKQKPKKIIRIAGRYPYKCPTCNRKLELGYKHCIICGQLLKYPYEN